MRSPAVTVGILTENTLSFIFNEAYIHKETGEFLEGEQRVLLVNNKIRFNGKQYEELFFEPASRQTATFDIQGVVIGKNFHWQQKQDQRFKGALNLLATEEGIVAINEVDIEVYLTSVISSEMNATSSIELLKAHAVISRSWLLAQLEKKHHAENNAEKKECSYRDEKKFIRWYDREDHALFDVCADDHCQRYQGIAPSSNLVVEKAVKETWGEILTDGQMICDTRFSKCCGGVTEKFEHCWEPEPHAYLTAIRDNTQGELPDLTTEQEADKWIRNAPMAFCHTTDKAILNQVLNNYDQETIDFYRWKTIYTQQELGNLLHKKTEGIDFGLILDLIPVKRGASGRITELKIVGSKKTFILGKELEIRRILSESHLYSSAFVVDKEDIQKGIPGRFILTGAGWGHGVGLCQIGAAVMATQNYDYKKILQHYYPGTVLIKKY